MIKLRHLLSHHGSKKTGISNPAYMHIDLHHHYSEQDLDEFNSYISLGSKPISLPLMTERLHPVPYDDWLVVDNMPHQIIGLQYSKNHLTFRVI